jgi:hypothetical protein
MNMLHTTRELPFMIVLTSSLKTTMVSMRHVLLIREVDSTVDDVLLFKRFTEHHVLESLKVLAIDGSFLVFIC